MHSSTFIFFLINSFLKLDENIISYLAYTIYIYFLIPGEFLIILRTYFILLEIDVHQVLEVKT